MRNGLVRTSMLAGLLLAGTGTAMAQTTVPLPDTSQTTTLTATVSEQARIQVPSGINFAVSDVSAATNATAANVTVTNIALATATKQLKISVQANAAAFTPPVGATGTWNAGDVTWNAATWTNATGSSGTLSNSSFGAVATCSPDVASCSTTGLTFTLGANSAVKRSGNHTLVMTWKFESIGS